jgi:tetratricopeptide (TPR) repeat protein
MLYAIALGAKESGVTLPGLIFLVDAAQRQIAFRDLAAYVRERWRLYAVMAIVASALLAGRYAILGSIAQPLPPLGADLLTGLPRIWTLGEVWTHYVRLWVFPLDLSSDYSPNVIPISFTWHATNVLGVVLALCVLLMALVAWRRPEMRPDSATSRAAAFGVVWFMVAISSTSNTLFLAGVMLAERTLYLPSVGLAAATGWLAVRLGRERPRLVAAVLCVALTAGAVRTWMRNPKWRDNQSVFTTMLAEVPHSGRSQWILGDRFIAAGNLSQGLVSYRAALNILGGHYTLVTEIAQRLMSTGRYESAERLLTFAWRDSPQFALAPSLIAWIRAMHGDAAGTERWSRQALGIYDTDATRWHLLAWSLAARGAWDEAATARRRGEELGPARFWHDWMYRAYTRREEGDADGALQALDSAWTAATDDAGRIAIDSVRVTYFGLESLLPAPPGGEPTSSPALMAPGDGPVPPDAVAGHVNR